MPRSEAPRVSPRFLPKPRPFFLSKLIFPSKTVEEIKTHVLQSIIFFFENRAVYEIMWKNILEADRPQMTMVHAHCMLDNQGYKHILGICNTYSFPKAKMITRTRLNMTLYVHCLPCQEI
jgi:hypothetical protein